VKNATLFREKKIARGWATLEVIALQNLHSSHGEWDSNTLSNVHLAIRL
jgi:hypothetical protein